LCWRAVVSLGLCFYMWWMTTSRAQSESWANETKAEVKKLLRQAGLQDGVMQVLTEDGPAFLVIKRAVARFTPQLLGCSATYPRPVVTYPDGACALSGSVGLRSLRHACP